MAVENRRLPYPVVEPGHRAPWLGATDKRHALDYTVYM